MVQSTVSSMRAVARRREEGVELVMMNLEAQLAEAAEEEVTIAMVFFL